MKRIVDGLRWRFDEAVNRMPPGPRSRIETWRVRGRVNRGEAAFDRARLTRTYLGAWNVLLREEPPEVLGDFLEFGVYYGSSLSCMYEATRQLGLDHVRFIGFDSFEGLPASAVTEDDGMWYPGQFRSTLHLTRRFLFEQERLPEERVTLVKGWFSDTAVPETAQRLGLSRASVIMIDCDLYSSTVESLAFCEPLIGSQAVLVFDDWNAGGLADRNKGERRAFEEFLARHPQFTATELPDLQYKDKGDPKIFHVRRR